MTRFRPGPASARSRRLALDDSLLMTRSWMTRSWMTSPAIGEIATSRGNAQSVMRARAGDIQRPSTATAGPAPAVTDHGVPRRAPRARKSAPPVHTVPAVRPGRPADRRRHLVGGRSPPAPAVHAAENPYERALPRPTPASRPRGPFATAQTSVSRYSVSGSAAATSTTRPASGRTFGCRGIAPGSPPAGRAWPGSPADRVPGFVVFNIDTITTRTSRPAAATSCSPPSTTWSPIAPWPADRPDPVGVMGHSMGAAARLKRPPTGRHAGRHPADRWDIQEFLSTQVPTLVVAPRTTRRAGLLALHPGLHQPPGRLGEGVPGAGRGQPLRPNAQHTIAKYSISWLKRFIDTTPVQSSSSAGTDLRPRRLRLPEHLPAVLTRQTPVILRRLSSGHDHGRRSVTRVRLEVTRRGGRPSRRPAGRRARSG